MIISLLVLLKGIAMNNIVRVARRIAAMARGTMMIMTLDCLLKRHALVVESRDGNQKNNKLFENFVFKCTLVLLGATGKTNEI